MEDELEELELLRQTGRIRSQDTQSLDWSNLTSLAHRRLAFVYPRLSTHEQRDRSIWSIERQRWLEDLARLNGYDAPLGKGDIEAMRSGPGYAGWYQNGQIMVDERDLGVSGTLGRQDRPALAHLIELIESSQVESVYTVEVSRLWRDKSLTGDRSLRATTSGASGISVDDALRFGRLCKERNVILVMPHMRLNLNDRMHWRIYRTEAERAAEELELMQYRLGGARAMKARQGFHSGGRSVPLGYVVDTDKDQPTYQRLISYPPHAEVVQAIFSRFVASGGSFFDVVNWCRAERIVVKAVPTDLAKQMKGRWAFVRTESEPRDQAVSLHLVRSVIANPKYIGWWVYKGEVVSRDNHPPIVDQTLFWEAARLASVRQPQRRGIAARLPAPLLAGLRYCCNHEGEPRPASSAVSRGNHYSYGCQRDYRNGQSDRQCLAISDYILERPIVEFVTTQCSYPQHVAAVVDHLMADQEHQQVVASERRRRERGLEAEITTLRANCQSLLSSAQYTPQRHADLECAIAEKQRRLQELGTQALEPRATLSAKQLERVRNFLVSINTEWPNLPLELRREFLTRIALERILISHDKVEVYCELTWRTGRVQRILIRRPFVDERTPWTTEEEDVLQCHFIATPTPQLLGLLPNRTWPGISRHARRLGLTRRTEPNGGAGVPKPRWQEWEMDLIRHYYDAQISKDELQEALSDRKWDVIKSKAHRMGLRWVRRQPWEPRLRWEEVGEGTALPFGLNVTSVMPYEARSRVCRRGR